MNQFRYLIGYVLNGGQSFGSIDITVPAPIVSQRDVASVERDLRTHFATPNVLVLSFSRYTNPNPNPNTNPNSGGGA
jgi:hypothetical protein